MAPPAPSPPRAASSRPARRPQPAAHPPCARSLPRARPLRAALAARTQRRRAPARPLRAALAARTQRRRAPARPPRCAPSRRAHSAPPRSAAARVTARRGSGQGNAISISISPDSIQQLCVDFGSMCKKMFDRLNVRTDDRIQKEQASQVRSNR
ncbi:hypothetical protein EJB05_26818, partial [Eragrostis curvula]